MRLSINDFVKPADLNILNQIVTYLSGTHAAFDLKVESVRIKPKGWLIEFKITTRGENKLTSERVAFFVIDSDTIIHCVWDQACDDVRA